MFIPTANLVSGQLVVCYDFTCEIYQDGQWNHLVDTREKRTHHSSATNQDRILLLGGDVSVHTTEWISIDGSPSQPGPFDLRHGPDHCTIQISDDVIVVTGGGSSDGSNVDRDTYQLVTEYHLTGDTNETPKTPMKYGRREHACGVYQNTDGQQVQWKIRNRSTSV